MCHQVGEERLNPSRQIPNGRSVCSKPSLDVSSDIAGPTLKETNIIHTEGRRLHS